MELNTTMDFCETALSLLQILIAQKLNPPKPVFTRREEAFISALLQAIVIEDRRVLPLLCSILGDYRSADELFFLRLQWAKHASSSGESS